ncbi:MAG: SiaB family protein kinase [Salibacteraceae bacterium]
MENKIIKDFTKDMSEAELLVNFHGEVSESRISEILSDVEKKLEETEEDFKKQRKVYNILVESLQNLYHHTDAFDGSELKEGAKNRSASFVLGRKEDQYHILTANYIETDNIAPLRARLDKINALDKEGLRDYYKEVLDNGQYSVHGGGGLGMIDIARKSKNKLDYNFAEVNDDFGLYILKIKV